jgi:1-acyl-sn-glycerol-3-phosphate acyltransferase
MRLYSVAVASLRLALYLGWTSLLLPVQILAVNLPGRFKKRFPRFYHHSLWRPLGFKVRVHGEPSLIEPTLFVSNHTSYLDITILGGLIEGSFVAKREVAGWPLFGLLAKLQRTAFIDRRRGAIADGRDNIAGRLADGDNLILFPEGTSNDGNRVLAFKSALFAAVDAAGAKDLPVQPVSIAYTALDGMPLGRALRPFVAWYGDMELAPHLFVLLGLGHTTIDVVFHPPVAAADFASRKDLARHCHAAVAGGVAGALTGRRGMILVQAAAG